MCRGRSKFVSDPGLNYKIATSLCIALPNSSSHFFLYFSPSLSFSFSLLYLFYFRMHTTLYSVSLSSPPSVSSSLREWDSCPTTKLWKYEHPPRERWLSESKVRRGRHTVVSYWIFHFYPWNIHRRGQRTRTTWVHCNNVALFVQLERLSVCSCSHNAGGGRDAYVCACPRVCCINCLATPPKVPLDHKDDWRADVPEQPLCHVWSVTASVLRWERLLKCVCVYLYKHMADSKRVGGCLWAPMRENRSAMTRATYVFEHPCMRVLRKYKVQKGFCCNVHLSVAAHRFLCFSRSEGVLRSCSLLMTTCAKPSTSILY